MNRPPDFRPRKSLGQNFMVDENLARKIVRAIDPQPSDLIVEIGPGFGVLTKHLVASGCRCWAVEVDARLLHLLQENFGHHPNFTLVHADFRSVDLATLTGATQLRLVGNIPYHITSHLVFTAFAQRRLLRDMLLTVQREVAERIVAPPGGKDYGILSVLSQTFARAELLFTVSPHVFRPRPGVESALVHWQFQPPPLPLHDEDFFITLVKGIFGQRRKTLRRSLQHLLPAGPLPVPPTLDLRRRPETLSVAEIITLANALAPAAK